MDDPKLIYECLLDYCSSTEVISRLGIGLVWTVCQTQTENRINTGLAMSPNVATRTLSWPGTMVGKALKDVAAWLNEWDPYQATVGMAAINCSLNNGRMLPEGFALQVEAGKANLSVFEHFLPLVKDQKVVVIGHYPGIEHYSFLYDWKILERQPQPGDYPDPAAEYLIPDADWVFISASTITNKTFPRLAELAAHANTVLMGPTVPWLPELYRFGINYLAGVDVVNAESLYQTAAEGGGVRIFENGVRYKVVPLDNEINQYWLKGQISEAYAHKQRLTRSMDEWYQSGNSKRFPDYAQLNDINTRLSRMDSAYKTVWDQQQAEHQHG